MPNSDPCDKFLNQHQMGSVKRIWCLSPMRAAKVQASLRIRAVSPEPSLLAHTSSESRGTFRQKARSLALLNGWACTVKICHDGMLEDTNSLDGAQIAMKDSSILRTAFPTWQGSKHQSCVSILMVIRVDVRTMWQQQLGNIWSVSKCCML